MISKCEHIEYLGFDDRKIMLFCIPLFSLFTPIIFEDIPIQLYMDNFLVEFIQGALFTTFIWLGIRYTVICLRMWMPDIKQTFIRLILTFGIGMLITYLLYYGIKYCLLGCERILEIDKTYGPPHITVLVYTLAIALIFKYEAIFFFYRYKTAILEKEKLQTAHVQTQLDNLRNQINPHFLFNSLNTLMNLIPKDQDRAMSYLEKLSKFYRYSVGKHDDTTINLTTEIDNAKIYADLLHERFGHNINIDFHNHTPKNAQILPMTLQLLIENAVKHNVVSKNNPLNIEVSTDYKENYISVKNNLKRKIQSVASTGMGIENIKQRFAYFTNEEVEIEETSNHFIISVPLIKSNTKI